MELSHLQTTTKTRLLHFFLINVKSGNKIPSELSLSKKLEVSRTVIRKVVLDLQRDGTLDKEKRIVHSDISINENEMNQISKTGELQFRDFFFNQVHNGFILPGNRFSVLELADQSHCNRTIVREFLYQFSRYGLIEKLPRKMWGMVEIDSKYIKDLLSARENIEKAALKKIYDNDVSHIDPQLKSAFDQISSIDIITTTPDSFQEYENIFFNQLLLVERNRFITEFYNHLHFISCFLYQWIPITEFDHIDLRHTFLIQLLEAIESQQLENSLMLFTDFYQCLYHQLEDSLRLLKFP
ncbi:MAG: GntR family transcriptional regulator [Deltaproteobacteria bacterium]|jgi:GntR family transcriptional regulator, transcriptional activator for L-galactonate catabolism|nr:GntR family transcriptional regulator [Deltaproteobacteria bacterium]MBT4527714.1 GntR family transcriptional regulator [Deltaproteobacteria bacterium]